MPRRLLPVALAATLAACGGGPTAWPSRPAGPATPVATPAPRLEYAGPPPPPPRQEDPGPPPMTGQVWLTGHWTWTGNRHEWLGGRWETPRPGHYWVPYRWQQKGDQWRLYGGYWQKQ